MPSYKDSEETVEFARPLPHLPDPGIDERGRRAGEQKPRRARQREKLFDRDDWKILAIFMIMAAAFGTLGGAITIIIFSSI